MGKPTGIAVTSYVVQNGKAIKREELPEDDQKRLACIWNDAALKEAGFVPTPHKKS